MLPARTPVGASFLPDLWRTLGRAFRLWRVPQPAASKPFHDDIAIGAAKLVNRWQQIGL
jgi:hypothetical protein